MAASELAKNVPAPYVPVKHKALSRQQWFARKEIIAEMKAMRATIDAGMKVAKDATWQRQVQERDALDAKTETAIDLAMQGVKAHYRPYWRDLYRAQKREKAHMKKVIAYEAKQKAGQPISAREAMAVANHPANPLRDLTKDHEEARRTLSRMQRADAKLYSDAHLEAHKGQFAEMKARQQLERQDERAALYAKTRGVTFAAAKASLATERNRTEERALKRFKEVDTQSLPTTEQRQAGPSETSAKQDFEKAAKSEAARAPTRSEQIKSRMADWRKRNKDKDFGREL
jgi:hypothetical protein